MKQIYIILIFLFLNAQILPALDFTWNGAGDGTTYEQGANWVGGVAPGSADQIIFDGITATLTSSNSSNSIANIIIRNGANITFNTAFGVQDNLFLYNGSTTTINAASNYKNIIADLGGSNTLIFTVAPLHGRELIVRGSGTILTHASDMDVPYKVGRDVEIKDGATFINDFNLDVHRNIIVEPTGTLTNNCIVNIIAGVLTCNGTCDPLIVSDCIPPLIPTMGEWALILFGLIVLSIGTIYVMRWKSVKNTRLSVQQ